MKMKTLIATLLVCSVTMPAFATSASVCADEVNQMTADITKNGYITGVQGEKFDSVTSPKEPRPGSGLCHAFGYYKRTYICTFGWMQGNWRRGFHCSPPG